MITNCINITNKQCTNHKALELYPLFATQPRHVFIYFLLVKCYDSDPKQKRIIIQL